MKRATARKHLLALWLGATALGGCSDLERAQITSPPDSVVVGDIDAVLRAYLTRHAFTGRVGQTIEARLGRALDRPLADLGRHLWFDPIQGLNDDNSCAGCHSPTNGWGDTQPIAIGIDNNLVVGHERRGPRNQRRSPMVINTALYPTLMWNSRFNAPSGDPFDNSRGFVFPAPEGTSLSNLPHLLTAQAFIPPTERVEAAGFHFQGNNDDLRAAVLARLNADSNYRRLFASSFAHVKAGAPITYLDFAKAIAEFEFTQTYANAPIDRYARGEVTALTSSQKRGADLFFGRAGCVTCHAVSGKSNEMFSDFKEHVAGIPQIMPSLANVAFDGEGANEDFGLEQATGKMSDRYAFRTSPLRNVALQPAFMHNGAFVTLEDAMRYHLNAVAWASTFTTTGLPLDLRGPTGPVLPVLARIDPLLRPGVALTKADFESLVDFVRNGLLDPDARPEKLRALIPATLPSGRTPLVFR